MIENPVDLINHINYASQVDMLKKLKDTSN